MCGRYYCDSETAREIEKVVRKISADFANAKMKGEIFPTNIAPVIRNSEGVLTAEMIKWGFPRYNTSNVMINARAETVLERPMFRKSARERRCVIPAKNFFEWDKSKTKISLSRSDTPLLYMAGIYNVFQEDARFCIITTSANASVSPIHDRMPLIIEDKEVPIWIQDDTALEYILNKVPVMLNSTKS